MPKTFAQYCIPRYLTASFLSSEISFLFCSSFATFCNSLLTILSRVVLIFLYEYNILASRPQIEKNLAHQKRHKYRLYIKIHQSSKNRTLSNPPTTAYFATHSIRYNSLFRWIILVVVKDLVHIAWIKIYLIMGIVHYYS